MGNGLLCAAASCSACAAALSSFVGESLAAGGLAGEEVAIEVCCANR